jgi:phosphoribosylformimino-5-aminoimidazole carboxamide ribotide isomerase
VLIPSIDLMGGKIVQLVQGDRKALEFGNFAEWMERFRKFPIVQLIDLDAAMGKGNNQELVEKFCAELPCQVGGGLRSIEKARAALAGGARKVIIGSSLFAAEGVDVEFATALAVELGSEHLVFAVDSRDGFVAVKGWKQSTGLRPAQAIRQLDPFCSTFLYTHIDTEGLMQGFPLGVLEDLRPVTSKKLIVAGGITTTAEIDRLDQLGIDAVVGMAIYTGTLTV